MVIKQVQLPCYETGIGYVSAPSADIDDIETLPEQISHFGKLVQDQFWCARNIGECETSTVGAARRRKRG